MKSPRVASSGPMLAGLLIALGALSAHRAFADKNPASKLFVSDVGGQAQIDTGDTVEDLTKRSVYSPQGTVIETKKPQKGQDASRTFSTMVYSNGTGAFFDSDTRVEVRKFVQEPFVPTRSDMDVEPSISQTQAFVSRGTVGLCTSKLVAGSTMTYSTPLGSVNIRGRKVVIQSEPGMTKISMLDGDGIVRAGVMDMGGHTIHAGEQAIIRPSAPGQPNTLEIIRIPPAEASQLDQKVSMACMAKRTVYFEVRDRQESNSSNGAISAFDGESINNQIAGGPVTGAGREIVAVPVVPQNLPVQYTVSPAAIITGSGKVITPGQGTPAPGATGQPGG